MSDKKIEIRSIIDNITTNDDTCTVEGKAICFNAETVLYKDDYDGYEYRELIDSHALDGIKLNDVPLLYNHDESKAKVLARQRDNTLTLDLREDGLYFKANLNTNLGKDVYDSVKNGDIQGCSFGFICDNELTENTDSYQLRKVMSISYLSDVSIVDYPAYDATTVEARSLADCNEKRKDTEKRNRLMLLTY
jgi:HK97 family phage prohead protease